MYVLYIEYRPKAGMCEVQWTQMSETLQHYLYTLISTPALRESGGNEHRRGSIYLTLVTQGSTCHYMLYIHSNIGVHETSFWVK